MRRIRRILLIMLLDVSLAAALIGGDYYFSYQMPQKLAAVNMQTPTGSAQTLNGNAQVQAGNTMQTSTEQTPVIQTDMEQYFSDTVVSTDTEYISPDIAVRISTANYDSSIIDRSDNGKHKRYGSKIAYTIADIRVRDVTQLKTAFAQDTYGVGYAESLSKMSQRVQSVLAVNGDSYSNNRHKNNGTIIRNGMVYRAASSTEETCVLFRDGTMKIYSPDTFNADQVIKEGAWQSWVFGPSLLDEAGNAKTDFLTWDYIRQSHPRTAIGYYEPGHYCLVVVDGRQPDYSRGMYLEELSQLFADLGCSAAYNLDGGHCSFMTKEASVISHPYKPKKVISDCIYIAES